MEELFNLSLFLLTDYQFRAMRPVFNGSANRVRFALVRGRVSLPSHIGASFLPVSSSLLFFFFFFSLSFSCATRPDVRRLVTDLDSIRSPSPAKHVPLSGACGCRARHRG